MKKDDIFNVAIEDMTSEGAGIGKVDGFPLFIKDAVIGDTVEAKVMKAKKNYAYARLMKVLKPSENRVDPPCPVARQCGGCQIQAMSYEAELRFKEKKILNNLKRIGGFEGISLEPIIGMKYPTATAIKPSFPLENKEGRIVVGFYAGRTHSIIENRDCLLGVEENAEILDAVISWMEECQVEPYNETDGTGLVRHCLIRKGFRTGELMVCLIVNGRKIPDSDALVEKLMCIKGMTSINLNVNREHQCNPGERDPMLWGKPFIEDWIGEVRYQISPRFFPGKSGTDRKAVPKGSGIRRAYGRGDRLGPLLRNRNHLPLSCKESKAVVWSGDCSGSHRGCTAKRRKQRDCQRFLLCGKGGRSSASDV